MFEAFQKSSAPPKVAVVGLGCGSLACYAGPEDDWTFYEINPAVERIARDARYFSFLQDCRARTLNIVLGDGRLQLRQAPEGYFGLIVLDAFSSDAIPVHLITQEAINIYLSKLADNGILALHICNRYLNLAPVLADLARQAGLICLFCDDRSVTAEEKKAGKDSSQWMVMARSKAKLGRLVKSAPPGRGFPSPRTFICDAIEATEINHELPRGCQTSLAPVRSMADHDRPSSGQG